MMPWSKPSIENRMPLPASHSRARFYMLQRRTFWLVIAIVFASGVVAGGVAFGAAAIHQLNQEAKGTP